MEKTKIIFLILPHVHLLDLAGPDQVFTEAIGQGAEIVLEHCSIERLISTSSNLGIAKLKMFNRVRINKGDYVFIPGAEMSFLTAPSIPYENEVSKWLNNGYNNGAFICSICTGAFFLARTGLLNRRKCTTHWKYTTELKEKYPLINLVEDILFTEDERVLTSAGVTAGIDMALYVTGKLKDDNFSFKVARELVVYMRRQGSDSQQSVFMNYRNHIHSGVHKVQDYLQENIHKKLTLMKLGDLACMSTRNLTRIFKKETGITINEYIYLIRKTYLQKLIVNPDITRKQLAALCGLKSERQVIRLLKTIN
jgi:transcriptional regulator GlxA family with amidase domain